MNDLRKNILFLQKTVSTRLSLWALNYLFTKKHFSQETNALWQTIPLSHQTKHKKHVWLSDFISQQKKKTKTAVKCYQFFPRVRDSGWLHYRSTKNSDLDQVASAIKWVIRNRNKIVMPFVLSARQPDRVEATTVAFQQPDDEIPRTRAPEAIQGKH